MRRRGPPGENVTVCRHPAGSGGNGFFKTSKSTQQAEHANGQCCSRSTNATQRRETRRRISSETSQETDMSRELEERFTGNATFVRVLRLL